MRSYRLEKALQLCEQYRITDAIVFLLERMGDINGALSLILEAVNERINFISEGVRLSAANVFPHSPFPTLLLLCC